MDIVLASNNKHKVAELQYFMDEMCRENGIGNIKILTLSDIGFTDEIIEDGKTFEDNALIKASAYKTTSEEDTERLLSKRLYFRRR